MITILWLIRSLQSIEEPQLFNNYRKENYWQSEWFVAALITFGTIVADITLMIGLIKLLNSI